MQTTFSIFLRTDQINSDGTKSVSLRVIQNRRHKLFSLRIFVKEKDWSSKKCQVNSTDSDFLIKNKKISKYKSRADEIISDYFIHDKILTFYEFKNHLFSNSYGSKSFYDFVETQIEASKGNLSTATIAAYKSQLNKLKSFRKELSFSEIDYNFIESYEKKVLQNNNRNTTNKALTFVKTFLNKSLKLKVYKGENPFVNFPISKVNGDRDHLNIKEVQNLNKILRNSTLPKNKENVLRYFLFCCYTGLRYSDIKTFSFANIKTEYIFQNGENKERKIIEIRMHKTQKKVRIPIIKQAYELIDFSMQKYKTQTVFNVLSSQPTNRYLKEIAKEAGIEKKITFHVARHTFGTNATELKIDAKAIQAILGHTNLKTTQIYTKTSDSLKTTEMDKMEEQL